MKLNCRTEHPLDFFCTHPLWEEGQGDLHERFEQQMLLFGPKITVDNTYVMC